MLKGLLIPVEGAVREVELPPETDMGVHVRALQEAVDGHTFQPIRIPEFIRGHDLATAYVDEEAKFNPRQRPNMRATDFLVPGKGIEWGDVIRGPMLLMGFNPRTGSHTPFVPAPVVERVRLIEREAA